MTERTNTPRRPPSRSISRRQALAGLGGVGFSALLVACGKDSQPDSGAAGSTGTSTGGAGSATTSSTAASGTAATGAAAAGGVAAMLAGAGYVAAINLDVKQA